MRKINSEDDFLSDQKIRESLKAAVSEFRPSDLCKSRIDASISSLQDSEKRKDGKNMNKMTKAAALIAACALISGMGVFAAGKITGTMVSSYSDYDYRRYSDLEKAEQKAGYQIQAPEKLSESCPMVGIRLLEISDTDDDGNSYNDRKGIELEYRAENGRGESLSLTAEPIPAEAKPLSEEGPYQEVWEINGQKVYYLKTETLFLPPNEKPSEEEKALERDNPFFQISYGSEKREQIESSSLIFRSGALQYTLFDFGAHFSSDELRQFAERLLEEKKSIS